MPSRSPVEADLRLATEATCTAGALILEHLRRDPQVRYKSPDQPVTDADLAADRVLRDALLGSRPGYGWLSEETADSPERHTASRVWIVDPLDGTRSFLGGYAEFAVSVGLAVDGSPSLGVVYNPVTDELYHATAGGGAHRNGEPIRVSGTSSLGATLLASRSEIARGAFESFRARWRIEPLGSTAYKMVQVADGRGDAFLSFGPKAEWDVCAAALIVAEAGGRVTNLAGVEPRFNRAEPTWVGLAVSNGALHRTLLDGAVRPASVTQQEGAS